MIAQALNDGGRQVNQADPGADRSFRLDAQQPEECRAHRVDTANRRTVEAESARSQWNFAKMTAKAFEGAAVDAFSQREPDRGAGPGLQGVPQGVSEVCHAKKLHCRETRKCDREVTVPRPADPQVRVSSDMRGN